MPPAFANRTALLVARDAWCTNPTAAAANYGPIAQWDVTLVTDLSFLFCANVRYQNRGCNTACSTFNDDISGWNVSWRRSARRRSQPLSQPQASVSQLESHEPSQESQELACSCRPSTSCEAASRAERDHASALWMATAKASAQIEERIVCPLL